MSAQCRVKFWKTPSRKLYAVKMPVQAGDGSDTEDDSQPQKKKSKLDVLVSDFGTIKKSR